MGYWRYVPYGRNGEPLDLERAQGRFSPHAWSFDPHFRNPHPMVHCLPDGISSGQLGREWGALPRPLDPTSART